MHSENKLLGIPFSLLSKIISLISVLAGVLIVLGWQTNNNSLKTLLISDIAAKANGGACIILTGIALWLVQYRSLLLRFIVKILSSVVVLISLLTIIETVFSINLGIDTILFKKAFLSGEYTGSYRMAFNAALSHFLVGVILYFLSTELKRFTLFFIFCHILVFSISLLGLVGFIFGLADFSETTGYNNMPPQAAVLFLYQAAGLFITYYTYQPVRIEIEYRFFAGIIFAASVILFVALLSNVEFKSTRRVIERVENNRQLKTNLDHILSDMAEVETSISGYLITDNKVYLEHFRDAEVDVPLLLSELAGVVKLNDIQAERYDDLAFLITEKFVQFRKMLEICDTQGAEAGLNSFRKYNSELINGELGNIVNLMIEEENHYLNIESEKLTTNSANARKIIYLNLIVQLLFLAVIFIVVNRNIKDRKIAISEALSMNEELEKKVQKRTALLAQSEEKYRLITENADDWIFLVGSDKTIKYISPSCERLTGFPADRFINDSDFLNEIVHPDDKSVMKNHYDILRSRNRSENLEYRIVTSEGEIRWLQHSCSAVYTVDGKYAGRLVTNRNITERKAAEEELYKLNLNLEQRILQRTAELKEANRELESFAYSVSHDLRAPLRHVNGFTDLLVKEFSSQLPEKAMHYLTTIRESNHRMGLLIDDLLNFSRTGRYELNKRLINMQSVLDEALQQIRHSTGSRKISWQIGSLPEVYGDYNLMRQVWINLIDNAVKYTRDKDEALIKIDYVNNHSEFVFSIQDNGVGFDMAHANKLFGVFQRLHTSPGFEGTGIGLANVHRIIQKHGGRTWADAKPNDGAVFYFSIPIQNS
jgi:PAS domain S-box-containing protein